MKTLIYKLIYNANFNRIIRPGVKLIYKLTGKKIISVSGLVHLNVGEIKFKLKTNQTSSVTQELFYEGSMNYEFTPLFIDLIRNEKVFLDIGTNIGYFSVIGSKINPDCKIFAFEPSVGSLHFLKENLKINQCKNVQVIEKAVSNMNGTLPFHEVTNRKFPWLKHNLNGSNSLANEYITKDYKSYDVELTTIESVVNEYKLKTIGLIKLDTECTEHMILDCSVDSINNYRPVIICEVYPVIENEVDVIFHDKIIDYDIYQYLHSDTSLIKIDAFTQINNDDPNRNFVFCPREKLNKIEKYIK